MADVGKIRIGKEYQAEIPDLCTRGEDWDRDQDNLETKVWDVNNPLTDEQIDQYLEAARTIGTFARGLQCRSSARQPSAHMSAAAACRDITMFDAMEVLHKSAYDIPKAIAALVPEEGPPVLCQDELETWTASEAQLFEEALDRCGKDFADIQRDFLPWKPMTSIIGYYYLWKTTDRYLQQKQQKIAEAEAKLKKVRKPKNKKTTPTQITGNAVTPGAINETPAQAQNTGAEGALVNFYKTRPRPANPDPRKDVSGRNPVTPAQPSPVIGDGSSTVLGKRKGQQLNGTDDHLQNGSASKVARRRKAGGKRSRSAVPAAKRK
ncbi:metastasis-associated protein MTA1-like [Ascaphus truei]|uniref:metastasis-associated protein MTA1-like n=1 Tax=Ascaphus truei TaxID=8439 RepID=UPI003F5993EE